MNSLALARRPDQFRGQLARLVMRTLPVPASLYDRSAHFLGYTLSTTSLETVEELVSSSEEVLNGDGLDVTLKELMGLSLDEVTAAYESYPRCSPLANARLLAECAGERLEWSEAPWAATLFIIEAEGEFGCGSAGVIGPRGGRVWRNYVVDVPADGTYSLELQERVGMSLRVVSCDLGCGDSIDFETDDANFDGEVVLPAGTHVFRAIRDLGDLGTIGFTLKGPL